MLQLCDAPILFTEMCWQSREVPKPIKWTLGSLRGYIHVQFSNRCCQDYKFNICFCSYMWIIPNSHATWQWSSSWSTSVNCVLQSYSVRASHLAKVGALSKLLIPRHHQGNRNSLQVRETWYPWVQVENANTWWPPNNHGTLSSLVRNQIQKEVKSLCKYFCICKLENLLRVWNVSIENVKSLLYWILMRRFSEFLFY